MTEEETVNISLPSESSFSFILFTVLGMIEIVLIGLSLIGIAGIEPEEWGWDQFTVGAFIAFAFFIFALILLIYWKDFMPFVLIKKTRRGKKEIADNYYKEIINDRR